MSGESKFDKEAQDSLENMNIDDILADAYLWEESAPENAGEDSAESAAEASEEFPMFSQETEEAEAPAAKKKSKLPWILSGAAVVILLIAGVVFWFALGQDMWEQHLIQVQAEKDAQVLEIAAVTAEEIADLPRYVNLQKADFTGSEELDAILDFMSRCPNVEVTYQVPLAGSLLDGGTTELRLKSGTYSQAELETQLRYLPRMKSLFLEDMQMPMEGFLSLQGQYPAISMDYNVKLLGKTLESSTAELDLSDMESGGLDAVLAAMAKLPQLSAIELVDADGNTRLSLAEVHRLQEAMPIARIHYVFNLFGKMVSTDDAEIIIDRVRLSDSDEAELRQALDILTNCKRFVLDMNRYGRISHEIMAQIREDYRETTKVVWRVWFATYGSCLTDRDVIRFVYNLFDSNCSDLQYCEDVEYIDFGHNEFLTDCSWVANMHKLKAIILSGSSIKDLEPFAQCEALEFLEIAWCGFIQDVTPLAGLENLKYLNISYTGVSDLSPLDDLDMEVVMAIKAKLPQAEKDRLIDLTLPPEERKSAQKEEPVPEETEPEEAETPAETETPGETEDAEKAETVEKTSAEPKPAKKTVYRFTGHEYGVYWRSEPDGKTHTPYYDILCEKFNYPNAKDTTW